MRGNPKNWKKLLNSVGIEGMKSLESDEFYQNITMGFSPPPGLDKPTFLRELDYESRADFNGIVLSVGDEIIHVYGKHLRRSIITRIVVIGERYSNRIVVDGLKDAYFSSAQCIRV